MTPPAGGGPGIPSELEAPGQGSTPSPRPVQDCGAREPDFGTKAQISGPAAVSALHWSHSSGGVPSVLSAMGSRGGVAERRGEVQDMVGADDLEEPFH